MHEAIIIGGGPAGLSAAIYLARKKIDIILLTKNVGGQALLSSDVENYIGLPGLSGIELIEKFKQHVKELGVKIKMNQPVISIIKEGRAIKVKTNREEYTSKVVIIATGRIPRTLSIKGEKEFTGRGVTYCATCDAPLYKDKTVAVIGGGNSALDAAIQLMGITKKVYIIQLLSDFTGDPVMIDKVMKSKKVEIHFNTVVKEIKGHSKVESIVIQSKNKREIPLDAVFIEIGAMPASDITNAKKNKVGEIKIDRTCKTNIPGIFAAGDVTDITEKQIIVAAGEGAKAALSAALYLSKKR